MIEVYRGSANSWECDEMGHVNVRSYVDRMMEGLAGFAHAVHMPHAFRPNSPSTLQPRDQNIRFIREIHPGRPLIMTAGVLEVADTSALIYQQMDHGDGSTAASYQTWVDHIDSETGKRFNWSARTRAALEAHIVTTPEKLAPRSIDMTQPPREAATLADALKIGAPLVGKGVVRSEECDQFGRMRAEMFMGRFSDVVPNVLAGWREEVAAAARARGKDVRTGGAVLEYRLVYRRWPRAGDRMEMRSALGSVAEKTHTLVHWILDPDSGEAYCTSEAVAVTMDLNARKIVPTEKESMDALRQRIPTGLSA